MVSNETKIMNDYVSRYYGCIINSDILERNEIKRGSNFKQKFERAYYRLPNEYKNILSCEFFMPNKSARNLWSKSTFYRLKKKAINRFIKEFKEARIDYN